MRSAKYQWLWSLVSGLSLGVFGLGCDVESNAPGSAKGVKLPASDADSAMASADGGLADAGAAGLSSVRGFYVIHSDSQSASVSVLDRGGRVLSDLLISSGSEAPGISTAFSGDVVPTSAVVAGDQIVLVDRGNHVLSWVQLEDGEVTRQVHAGLQSFGANPYDYVEAGNKAFIARFEANPMPSGELDEGSDLLVLDVASGEPKSAVSLTAAYDNAPEDVLPRPTDLLLLGDRMLVLTAGIDATFSNYAESRLLVVDPKQERVEHVHRLRKLRNCTNMVASPSGQRVAISCMGPWGDSEELESGVVVLDVTGDIEETWRVMAAEFDGARTAGIGFIDETRLLVVTLGEFGTNGGRTYPDRAWQVEVSDAEEDEVEISELLEAPSPFVFSGLRCEAALQVCLIADIETEGGVLHWLELNDGAVARHRELKIDDSVGLPPRYIGVF